MAKADDNPLDRVLDRGDPSEGVELPSRLSGGDLHSAPDPTADPSSDPAADPSSDPTADPSSDPAADPSSDPAADPSSDSRAKRRRAWRVLLLANALVFASSMCIMILELVAARLIASNLGASLYTWTSVIGVILAGISIGNYTGGKIADRMVPRRVLPFLFWLASMLSFSVLWLNQLAEQWSRPEALSWQYWVLLNVVLIFLLPAVLLGTIGPVVAKMALDERLRTGSTVGNIYAWAAVGSILGTFLTGFLLIDLMGTRAIVGIVAAVLAMIGLAIAVGQSRVGGEFIFAWLVLLAGMSTIAYGPWPWAERWGVFLLLRYNTSAIDYFDESNYFAIQVYDDVDVDDTKVLALDNLVHSYVPTDDITRLIYDYETIYAAVTKRAAAHGRPLRSFFIGGGGFVFPRYMEKVYPTAAIDVAEIDPAVKTAALEALGLPPDDATRIRTHLMDARNFVDDRIRRNRRDRQNQSAAEPVRYDFIYGDAFNDLSVPYHLTTREFNDRLRELLAPDGVYMINVIDIYAPGLGRFLGAFTATARKTFPNVYVFTSDMTGPTDERDTFVVVCSIQPLPIHDLGERPEDLEFEGMLFAWSEGEVLGGEMETLLERSGGLILTDDYAPVENLLAPLYETH